MSTLWSAVKQMRSEKRFRNAPAPLDALSARVRQLSKDLALLRRAVRDNKSLVHCINSIIAHCANLPADVDKVAKWCDRLVGPFILYIEGYTQLNAPSSLSSLLKAPFIFLEEAKDLLKELERITYKACGVSAISALLSACRRMLTLQSCQEGTNDFEFSQVKSFRSGEGVSAAFNPVDIVERALFDVGVGNDQEIVGEVLLLQSHGIKTLAICAVKQSGTRSLLFPPFKGRELEVESAPESLTLYSNDRTVVLKAAPYVIEHWTPIVNTVFAPSRSPSPPPQVHGLGIAFSSDEDYERRNREEKFGDEFDDEEPAFDRKHAEITPSQSLNALKRISVGMPMDFSEDLAKILKGIEEEDSLQALGKADRSIPSEVPSHAPPQAPVKPKRPARPTTATAVTTSNANNTVVARGSSAAAAPALYPSSGAAASASALPHPTAPFAAGSAPRSAPIASASPAFSAASASASPRTLDEADALRRRISQRISAREAKDQKNRLSSTPRFSTSTPLTTHTQDSVASLSSIMLSDASSIDRNALSIARVESLRNTPAEMSPAIRAPPSIPAPTITKAETASTQKATVVQVTMPKRSNFAEERDGERTAISSDLGHVPGSPVAPATKEAARASFAPPPATRARAPSASAITTTATTAVTATAPKLISIKPRDSFIRPDTRGLSTSESSGSLSSGEREFSERESEDSKRSASAHRESLASHQRKSFNPFDSAAAPQLTLPDLAKSTPALAASPRLNPPAPRTAVSMYSPKLAAPEMPRSHSDENGLGTPLVSTPSAQPNIWFTDEAPKSSKVKAFTKFFKIKPKSPKISTPKLNAKAAPPVPAVPAVPKAPATVDTKAPAPTPAAPEVTASPIPSAPSASEYVYAAPAPAAVSAPAVPVATTAAPSNHSSSTLATAVTAAPSASAASATSSASTATATTFVPRASTSASGLSTSTSSEFVSAKDLTAYTEPTVAPPSPPLAMPRSISNNSFSTSEPDLNARLHRASTSYYGKPKLLERNLFDGESEADTTADSEANTTANTTVDTFSTHLAASNSGIPASVASSQSYNSIQSRATMSTANTSVGSTKAWAEFMSGVNTNVARQREDKEREKVRDTERSRKAQELEKLEREVQRKKEAIEEAAYRVNKLSQSVLDPGKDKVNRSVPLLRDLYEEKERLEAANEVRVDKDVKDSPLFKNEELPKNEEITLYKNPSASVPILCNGVTPLVIKKPKGSVTFSEPSTPTSPGAVTFNGFMWVSRWTVNRWVPLSQSELPVEIQVTAEHDLIVVSMPGSSRPVKLRYSSNSDIRLCNAHDVELRVKDEVYMFRCRSSQRCKKFFNAVEALSVDIQDPKTYKKLTDSDSSSSSGSSSTSSGSRSRCAPPKLAAVTKHQVCPIIEE